MASATAAMMSAVVKGCTSELLVSFIRFGLGRVLLFGLFLFFPTTEFWFPAGGSFRGAFGLAVQRGSLWGVTCLCRFFGGSVFFVWSVVV